MATKPKASGSRESAETTTLQVPRRSRHVDMSDISYQVWQGMMVLKYLEPAEVHLADVKSMELFDDDVLLCTYPKSGTHWMFRILDMLTRGSAQYLPQGQEAVMTFNLLDFQPVKGLQDIQRPRILPAHYPFYLLPDSLYSRNNSNSSCSSNNSNSSCSSSTGSGQGGQVKLVHVYRNPKAVAVSMAMMGLTQRLRPQIRPADVVDLFLKDTCLYKSTFHYWDTVREFEERNPNFNIFHISYEDLKKDTVGSIRRLAQYLGREADEQFYTQVADAVSFDVQKMHDRWSGDTICRIGEADDWKQHLSVAHSERVDEVLRQRATTCPFSRHYV